MRDRDAAVLAPPLQRWRSWQVAAGTAIVVLMAVLASLLTRPLPPPKIVGSSQITHDSLPKMLGSRGLFRSVTDGSRIYFTEFDGSHLFPVQVPVEGGEVVPLTSPLRDALLLDLAPKRSELLVTAPASGTTDVPLWILPIMGASPRRLGDILPHDAAWSPDGEQIQLQRPVGQIP